VAARANQSGRRGRVPRLLQRRPRARETDAAYERAAVTAFAADTGCGYFEVEPLIDRNAIALRTLDALHLAIA
jgi:hypothetical protein